MANVVRGIAGFVTHVSPEVYRAYKGVLTNGFDESRNYPVRLAHFNPFSSFYINPEPGFNPRYSFDASTGDPYWNDNPHVTRLKCLALIVATPIVHAIGLVLNLANRIAKVITGAHFWRPLEERREDRYVLQERRYREIVIREDLSARRWTFGKDILRAGLTPALFIGLELSAIYGLLMPNQGRKLYATLERFAYGGHFLAPCFQPRPVRHLFGGAAGPNNW